MRVIDSHTEGEPTRVIIAGGPPLGDGPLSQRLARFANDFDPVRRFAIDEPRGHEALVGALLCKPHEPDCAAGVIFFNNKGFLGMCGHGAIGVAVTLAHLGRITLGRHRIDTPVGVVDIHLTGSTGASVENVESYRYRKAVRVDVGGLGSITGDIAWGGNWFFLTEDAPCPLEHDHIGELAAAANAIRMALHGQKVTGAGGAEIDHVEFFGAPRASDANSRNFVLCPGGAYDRSPCGTGTSAKLACLAAEGRLAPGATWVQESIIGSRFAATYRPGHEGGIVPTIAGRAFICAEATLLADPADPFGLGLAERS